LTDPAFIDDDFLDELNIYDAEIMINRPVIHCPNAIQEVDVTYYLPVEIYEEEVEIWARNR
jgi:hypothetical protein